MRIIHTADLHLHSKIEGLPTEKAKIRREEVLRTFERLCAYAKENDVTAVILAGDVFDTSKNSEKVIARFFEAIANASPVDFIAFTGNHDDGLDFTSQKNLPNNFKVISDEWAYFNYQNVVISGIVMNNFNAKILYDSLSLEEDKVNIVALHGQVVNYVGEPENDLIFLPKLKEKYIDYLALGHIHSYSKEKLDNRGYYAYSGCLEGRGFDETGEKGFILLEIDGKEIKTEFIPFAKRYLYTVEFDVTSKEHWFSTINEIVNSLSKYDKDSLIKLVLIGEHGVGLEIDTEILTSRLNEEFFFAKVYDQTTLKVDLSDYINDKSVRGEFVRKVLSSNLSQEEKDAIVKIGLTALKGEGV